MVENINVMVNFIIICGIKYDDALMHFAVDNLIASFGL